MSRCRGLWTTCE